MFGQELVTGICIFESRFTVKFLQGLSCYSLLKNFQLQIHIRRFMLDNDPKHCSRAAQKFYDEVGINWWCTPPESPDLNPIENLWHELKEYLRRVIKPRTKEELVDGITTFWAIVDTHKYSKYIGHL